MLAALPDSKSGGGCEAPPQKLNSLSRRPEGSTAGLHSCSLLKRFDGMDLKPSEPRSLTTQKSTGETEEPGSSVFRTSVKTFFSKVTSCRNLGFAFRASKIDMNIRRSLCASGKSSGASVGSANCARSSTNSSIKATAGG